MATNHNSLYRTYRPSTFKDVAGHRNVVEILTTELKNNSFGHAYLFAGQRGTGKTSMARIFAKAVNCLNLQDGNPCNQCENCIAFNENKFSDIYEIDAASNNGVDEIRNIKSNIQTLPIIGKYKVYIIDEVHMLTKGAFNALLKTLEEPPVHAIFILATTEYDKIPQTIVSRCQTFSFKKISSEDLKERLNYICEKEGYKLDTDAANEIYSISEGSLRDALNVLEQLMVITYDTKSISVSDIKKVFYIATKEEKLNILKEIINKESNKVINYFEQAKRQGMDFDVFALSLIKIIKEIIEYKLTNESKLLEEINKEDADQFMNVKLSALFNITDNLTDAYIKTKNNNASFDYILLSILKSIDVNEETIVSAPIIVKSIAEEVSEPIVEKEEKNIDNNTIKEEKTIEDETVELSPLVEELINNREALESNTSTSEASIKLDEDETIQSTIPDPDRSIKLDDTNDIIDEKTLSMDEDDENLIAEFNDNEDEITREIEIVDEENDDSEPTIIVETFNESNDSEPTVDLNEDIEEPMVEEIVSEPLLAKNTTDLRKIQLEKTMNDNSKEITYLVNDVVNVLMGVLEEKNPNLRHELNDRISNIFETNENDEFIDPNLANDFVSLLNSNVVAANNNELIITTEGISQASQISKELTNQKLRSSLFDILGKEYVVYTISFKEWNEVKNVFGRLKKNNLLPQYVQISIEDFYKKNKDSLISLDEQKNKEAYNKASKLFDEEDFEIGE